MAAAAKAPRRPAPEATIWAAPPVIGAPVAVGVVYAPPGAVGETVPLPVLLPPVVPLPPTISKLAQEMRVLLAKWKTIERFPKKLPGPSTWRSVSVVQLFRCLLFMTSTYQGVESIVVGRDEWVSCHLAVLAGEIASLASLWGGRIALWFLTTDEWIQVGERAGAVARGIDWENMDVVHCCC